jgi:sugar phosphate isomerase/epimerase
VFGDRIGEKYGDTQSRAPECIARLCALSDKVTVLLEVHGDFNTVDALKPVLERLEGIENFGLIWDIGHTHRTYGDRWREFYSFVRPYVRHVHVKDISDSGKCLTLPGEGNVLIREIAEGLLADGYGGYFSLEWEKKWHPELPDIEPALEGFLRVMDLDGIGELT